MRAYAGIGCHYMAQWMDRSTLGYTQMGGEGANWIGEAPFSKRKHVFQNLGDGTYNHSGYMAIRGAIASGVNITYKILFNDAVAMTGGQANDGGLTVPQIARQVAAEGAKKVVVVTDEPWKYAKNEDWPKGLTIFHRDELNEVQKSLAEIPGVTVLIYDQTCAAEKRRRRKRGKFPDPDKRVIINELVCEGCGDCGVKSNCVSVQPLETEWGRKRTIDQSSCNKDFSCVRGLLPVVRDGARRAVQEGHRRRRRSRAGRAARTQAAGDRRDLRHHRDRRRRHRRRHHRWHPGHGGASRRQGRRRARSWPVSRRRAAPSTATCASPSARRTSTPSASRPASAELVLGGDIVVVGNKKVLAAVKHGQTDMVVNLAEFLPGDFTRNADFSLPTERLKRAIIADAGRGEDPFHRRDARRQRAVRQHRRRQHLPGRLCLSARRHPARGGVDRAGDRTQRRSSGDEQGGVPLGPPRRGRAGRARGAAQARRRTRAATPVGCRSRSTRRSSAASPSSPPIRTPRYARALSLHGSRRRRPPRRSSRRAAAGWPRRWRAICSS